MKKSRRWFLQVLPVTAAAVGAGVIATLRRRSRGDGQADTQGPFVIAEPCIGVKDGSCVEVCPVDAIHSGEDQFYIHPDECIWCGACEAECPVQAIFPASHVPAPWKGYIAKNRSHFL